MTSISHGSTPRNFSRSACWLASSLLAFAGAWGCSEDEPEPPAEGTLGSECDLEKSQCEAELECTPVDDDKGRCTFAAGAECTPDADEVENGGCALSAVCEAPAADAGADSVPVCRILKGESCDPGQDFCAAGLGCAELESGEYRCFEPVLLRGVVSDTATADAIEGAHLIALDSEGSAATSVFKTDAEGVYWLELPAVRKDDGSPADQDFTLSASAQDYQAFPYGVRVALPINLADAESTDDGWVVDNALTQVGLIPLPAAERYQISGRVQSATDNAASNVTGVLVVAKGEGAAVSSATTDLDGQFTIFNVSPGDYTVSAYAADLQVGPESAAVDNASVDGVVLQETTQTTVEVQGNIQIVNAPGGSVTSVILVVADTFDAQSARGEVPRGLRAPKTGPVSVTGDFVISGVPDGEYVVLAAYENDALVRDPDTNISGTAFVRIEVSADAGSTLSLSESFKVTEALTVMSPGAEGPEAVDAAPLLRWADDSSEDWYEVTVFDALGNAVWNVAEVPSVSGGDDVTLQYEGPLDPGMYYQFRVSSWRQPGNGDAAPISATEDLRGVFFKPAP